MTVRMRTSNVSFGQERLEDGSYAFTFLRAVDETEPVESSRVISGLKDVTITLNNGKTIYLEDRDAAGGHVVRQERTRVIVRFFTQEEMLFI